MTVFDYIVDQLLEILRLAIYRYAHRAAPARKSRREALEAESPRKVEKRRARRRSSGFGNLLLWVVVIAAGFVIYRRLVRRA
jgi:hypothetical protein